jgi:single-strand DNA-binding protein
MFLVRSTLLRSFQPTLVRTAKTSATDGTKNSKSSATDDESFLDEAASETDNQAEKAQSTGRERSLNRIQLIGRVGADPKVGGTKQHKVVLFNLATNEYAGTNTANGEIKQRVDWHRIAVFQPRLLDNAEKYVRQGDRIYVQGRVHHNMIKDKKTGEDRYVTSVIADDMIFLTKN